MILKIHLINISKLINENRKKYYNLYNIDIRYKIIYFILKLNTSFAEYNIIEED